MKTIPSDLAHPSGEHAPGMSKREYIATEIFAAAVGRDRSLDFAATAAVAVEAADALIAALNAK